MDWMDRMDGMDGGDNAGPLGGGLFKKIQRKDAHAKPQIREVDVLLFVLSRFRGLAWELFVKTK